MKTYLTVILCIVFGMGCARVKVEGPKEPIKVDISMRLDIYQHVAKDIDDIESIVSGSESKPEEKAPQSRRGVFIGTAFAQESELGPEVQQAALNRRDRRPALVSWQEKGVLGENKSGLIVIKGAADSSVQALVDAENKDRMVIYQAVAEKNRTSVEEVQKLYAKRLQTDAPTGTPIEVVNEDGSSQWRIK
ncbi:MAG: hypothetical protein AMJ95_04900 [Omnitrophica WOR_2 bacterium SM23_72]|nr:MAG: hypothetical protein AMJ95_04900 [Omnitrophica WOR_2 bacterium SM23_72]